MTNLNVTYQDIESAATRLTAGQDEITTRLTELRAFIASLISSGFVTDQASVAFGESYERFNGAANEVVSNLTNLSQYLHSTARTLQETDASLAAGLRGR